METKFLKFASRCLTHYYIKKMDRYFNTNLSKPATVMIYVTHACNSRCKFCTLNGKRNPNELGTEEWKKIFFSLKEWLGYYYLNLMGGEPFLRKDLFEIANFASENGAIVDITTNGFLINKKIVKKIAASGISKIIFSLDGMNPETHDWLRQPGFFDKVISAIDELKNENINITLNTVINKCNMDQLEDLVMFTHRNNLNGIRFIELQDIELMTQEMKRKVLPNDKKKIKAVMDNLILLKKNGYPIMNSVKNLELIKMYFLNISSGFKGIFCDLPFDQLCIDAFGNVLPCYKANKFFTESLGNLLSKKPEDVWNSETYVKSRKLRSRCMKRCMLGDGYVSNDGIFSNAKRFYMGFRKNIGS